MHPEKVSSPPSLALLMHWQPHFRPRIFLGRPLDLHIARRHIRAARLKVIAVVAAAATAGLDDWWKGDTDRGHLGNTMKQMCRHSGIKFYIGQLFSEDEEAVAVHQSAHDLSIGDGYLTFMWMWSAWRVDKWEFQTKNWEVTDFELQFNFNAFTLHLN